MSYKNTFIKISEDSTVTSAIVPVPRNENNIDELREQFFTKPKTCFRASPLVKKYGWGVHYDDKGKIAIYDVKSETYNQFFSMDNITIVKGMRAKRQ